MGTPSGCGVRVPTFHSLRHVVVARILDSFIASSVDVMAPERVPRRSELPSGDGVGGPSHNLGGALTSECLDFLNGRNQVGIARDQDANVVLTPDGHCEILDREPNVDALLPRWFGRPTAWIFQLSREDQYTRVTPPFADLSRASCVALRLLYWIWLSAVNPDALQGSWSATKGRGARSGKLKRERQRMRRYRPTIAGSLRSSKNERRISR